MANTDKLENVENPKISDNKHQNKRKNQFYNKGIEISNDIIQKTEFIKDNIPYEIIYNNILYIIEGVNHKRNRRITLLCIFN